MYGEFASATGLTKAAGPTAAKSSRPACEVQNPRNQGKKLRPFSRRDHAHNWAYGSRGPSSNKVVWACMRGTAPHTPTIKNVNLCTEAPQAQLGTSKKRAQQQCSPIGLPARNSTQYTNDKNCDPMHGGSASATGRIEAACSAAM